MISVPLTSHLKTPMGATLLYKQYRYVPPQRVGFLGLFGLKTSTNFAYFGLESGMVSFQFQMSKKEREICEVEMDLHFSYLSSNLSNDDTISA